MSVEQALYDLRVEVIHLDRGSVRPVHDLSPYDALINAAAHLIVTAGYLKSEQASAAAIDSAGTANRLAYNTPIALKGESK